MKFSLLLASVMCNLFPYNGGAEYVQIGQPQRGTHHVLQGLVLVDNMPVSEIKQSVTEPQRFTIVLVRNEAILLDMSTGETWCLVFPDSEKRQLHWKPIPVRGGKSASRPNCGEKQNDHNEGEFDPFQE